MSALRLYSLLLAATLVASLPGRLLAQLDAGVSAEAAEAAAADAFEIAAGHLAAGRRDAARDAYGKALENGDARRFEAMVAMARIDRLQGRGDDSRRRLLEVLADWRRTGAASARETVAAGEAAALLGERDPAYVTEALAIFERAIDLAPSDPAPKLALADLLLDRYNNQEALPLYREALEIDSENAEAVFGLARSQYFDRSRAAVETVRRALELSPDMAPARVFLARLLLDAGDFEAVGRELDAVLAADPLHPGALTIRAAVALLSAEDELFETRVSGVAESSPGYRALYSDLAEIAAENRLYGDAVDIAREGARKFSDDWKVRALLGVNLFRLGRVEEGRGYLEAAFRGDPYNVWIKNTLDLIDKTREFATVRKGRFELLANARDAAVLAPTLFPLAERAFDFFEERYGHTPRTPVRIEFYNRRDDFSVRTVGLVGLDLLGVSFGPVVTLVSPADLSSPVNWGSVLWHELAHTFHLSMTRWRVARWFTEGLSVYEEHLARPGWGADVDPGFLAAWREGRLPPASRLDEAFTRPTYRGQIPHAYFLSSLLIAYIERERGVDGIRAMLDGYADGRGTPELLAEVLERPVAEVDEAFESYVAGRYAHVLAGLGLDGDGEGDGGTYREALAAGRKAFDSGEFDEAERRLAEARHQVPELAGEDSPYHLLAQLYGGRGETALAIRELEAIAAIDAEQLSPLLELADLYEEGGRSRQAAGALRRVLYIDPFDAKTRERLAGILEASGDYEAAVTERRAVLELAPTDPAGARYRLARALNDAGDAETARRELLGALESAPLYEDALELLLEVRGVLGHDDRARAARTDQPITE